MSRSRLGQLGRGMITGFQKWASRTALKQIKSFAMSDMGKQLAKSTAKRLLRTAGDIITKQAKPRDALQAEFTDVNHFQIPTIHNG